MKKSDKMRQLMEQLAAKKAVEPKKKEQMDADVNKDGKVDEQDVSIVKEAAKKIKKKIVKKKD